MVARTAELMREHDTDDIAPYGEILLGLVQRYLNFHYSVSLDLFGSETSTNVANYFTNGLKGRWQEQRRKDDHVLTEDHVRGRRGRRRRTSPPLRIRRPGRAQPRPARAAHGRLPGQASPAGTASSPTTAWTPS
ncbi:hypothetical protein ACU686_31085 [Yinghuangia aomiensis]